MSGASGVSSDADANYRWESHTSEISAIDLHQRAFPDMRYFADGTNGCVQAVSNSASTLPFTFGFEETIFART
jgi:hypothetical protein